MYTLIRTTHHSDGDEVEEIGGYTDIHYAMEIASQDVDGKEVKFYNNPNNLKHESSKTYHNHSPKIPISFEIKMER